MKSKESHIGKVHIYGAKQHVIMANLEERLKNMYLSINCNINLKIE